MEIAGTVAGGLVKTKVNFSASPPEHLSLKETKLMVTQNTNHASVLRLPLTEDLRLKHSLALSNTYYRNVMANSS
jgi:hypothetical protein